MASKRSGGGELAQLVTNHILGNVNRNMFSTVVNREGVADKIREDGGSAAPGLEDALFAFFVHFLNPLEQHRLYKGSLLNTSAHSILVSFPHLLPRRLTIILSERLCFLRVL